MLGLFCFRSRVTRREARTVDLALTILRRASRLYGPSARSDGVQIALRVLLPYVDKHSLMVFWRVCENDNPAQRVHTLSRLIPLIESAVMRAAANRIG